MTIISSQIVPRLQDSKPTQVPVTMNSELNWEALKNRDQSMDLQTVSFFFFFFFSPSVKVVSCHLRLLLHLSDSKSQGCNGKHDASPVQMKAQDSSLQILSLSQSSESLWHKPINLTIPRPR